VALVPLVLACATSPSPVAEAPRLEPAEPPGAEPASGWPAPPLLALPSTARPAGRKASELGPDALVALCQDLRDEGATHFPGNAVEQAQAAAAHAEQRQAALSTSYVAVVPSGGFAFRDYAMGEHNLVLDTARSFVLGEGAELFVAASDSPPTFPLSPDIALRLLAEHGAGHLVLRLVFRAAPSQIRKDGCMWLSGGHVVKMEVDLIGAALLRPDGEVLVRATNGEYGDSQVDVPVRSPKVRVKKPRTADGRDAGDTVARALAPLANAAESCYQRVLALRPALRGTVVLAIRVAGTGKLDDARVEMSSLGDDAVAACVEAAAGKATLTGVPSGRFSVPLHFASAEEL